MGIFLVFGEWFRLLARLPHAGGGIPAMIPPAVHPPRSAPRKWGYTPAIGKTLFGLVVCPTRVGIYTYDRSAPPAATHSPHTNLICTGIQKASPRQISTRTFPVMVSGTGNPISFKIVGATSPSFPGRIGPRNPYLMIR